MMSYHLFFMSLHHVYINTHRNSCVIRSMFLSSSFPILTLSLYLSLSLFRSFSLTLSPFDRVFHTGNIIVFLQHMCKTHIYANTTYPKISLFLLIFFDLLFNVAFFQVFNLFVVKYVNQCESRIIMTLLLLMIKRDDYIVSLLRLIKTFIIYLF